MSDQPLATALAQWQKLLPNLSGFETELARLGQAMLDCWAAGGKILTAGNGGSAADAIHLAEELVVCFDKPRRALAAIALCDPGNLTCAGNDMGYEKVFSRQIEALGNRGDILIVFTTSGKSPNILAAVAAAKKLGVLTAAFLGKSGGKLKGGCDFEFHIPSEITARVQEAHLLIYHSLCQWIDNRLAP